MAGIRSGRGSVVNHAQVDVADTYNHRIQRCSDSGFSGMNIFVDGGVVRLATVVVCVEISVGRILNIGNRYSGCSAWLFQKQLFRSVLAGVI